MPLRYEHLESSDWGDVKVQTGTNTQRRQRCIRNHAIRFNGKEFIVWHIPKNISKTSSMFLTVSYTSIEAEVVGKRLNRGGGYGLEIPVQYHFYGPPKTLQWLIKQN